MAEADVENLSARCRSILPSWCRCYSSDVCIESLEGGLTNDMFVAVNKNANASPRRVIIRVYGKGSSDLINREVEHEVYQLVSKVGLGPRILGFWNGGRIESFIPGRTLRFWDDFYRDEIINGIAKGVAILHKSQVLKRMPYQKEPMLHRFIRLWSKRASSVKDGLFASTVENAMLSFNRWFQFRIKPLNPKIVLCHNDLNALNILVEESEFFTEGNKSRSLNIHFIDYEYAGWNYRGFDLANLYCEVYFNNSTKKWPYFDFDADRKCWNSKQFQNFCVYYLREYMDRRQISEEDLLSLQHEVRTFEPLSHLVWGLWGLIQAQKDSSSFGYSEYGLRRLQKFQELASEYSDSIPR